MNVNGFVSRLAAARSPNVFNPYAHHCDIYDKTRAAAIRRANLRVWLKRLEEREVDSLWVGRDLGYLGGRRTGIPLTDDANLGACAAIAGGIRLRRATRGAIKAERTATYVWPLLQRIDRPVVLWNVFPWHPHPPGQPLANRRHTARELQMGISFLGELLTCFRPARVIALGRDAEQALAALDCRHAVYVRHPSFGGQRQFAEGVAKHYRISR